MCCLFSHIKARQAKQLVPVQKQVSSRQAGWVCGWATGKEPVLAHVLVATDAALRGLDCSLPAGLALLVSYDCPTRKARLLVETVYPQKP